MRLCHEFPLGRDCFKAMLERPDNARSLEEPLWRLAALHTEAASVTVNHETAGDAAATSEQPSCEQAEDVKPNGDALSFCQLMAFAWRVCKADADQRCEAYWRLFGSGAANGKQHAFTLSTEEVIQLRPHTCCHRFTHTSCLPFDTPAALQRCYSS